MKNNIDIKEPCSEDWANMTPTQKGAFCNKCAMEVYDFSNKSGNEIRDVLKLNIGGSVCGRLKPSQIAELNQDFNAWNLTNKTSFQSALIFSLIVAFGMTLFGCEEDEQNQQIKEIQSIGLAFMLDGGDLLNTASNGLSKSGELQVKRLINHQVTPIDYWDEPMILGAMKVPDYSIDSFTLDTAYPFFEITHDGGIGYSLNYANYLEELPYANPNPTLLETSSMNENFEFKAFAFPNPAIEKTTLRIVLPKKEKVQIKLFNMAGQFIKDVSSKKLRMGESDIEINLIDLPKGIYIISIISNSFNESVRFIKR